MVSPAVRQPDLADFGIARLVDATATKTNSRVGTPSYMAPELVTGMPVGRSSDICSLGVLLYEALVGRPPFTGVCALIGEESGTAPPVTTSGHFSSYSAPYYIKDGPHVDRCHHVPGGSPARLSDATGRPEESS
jgi:serine/threonine protein kinase